MSDVDEVLVRMQTDYDFYLAVRVDAAEALAGFDLDDSERAAFAEPETPAMWRLLAARSESLPVASRERASLNVPISEDDLVMPPLDTPRPLGPFPPDPPPPDPPPPPPPPPDPPPPPIVFPPSPDISPPPIVIPPIEIPPPPPPPVVSPSLFGPTPLPFGGPSPHPFGMPHLVVVTAEGGDEFVDRFDESGLLENSEVSRTVDAVRQAGTPEDRLAALEHLMEMIPWRR